jgi:hypothetical protein
MPYKPNIRRLVDDRDMDGLITALRYPDNPEIRVRAARALGQIGNVKTVESLIRSHLQDPDPGAQQAALDALHQIIGSEAELAISAYVLPEETWIEENNVSSEQSQEDLKGSDSGEEKSPLEEDEESEDDLEEESEEDLDEEGQEESVEQGLETGEISWGENDIQALVALIRLDHSRNKRIKAIQALSHIPNTRAIDALASIALWSEERRLREAAREALSGIYGDSLDEVLQSYRQASQEAGFAGDEDDGDKEDDEDEEDEEEGYEDNEDDDDDEEEVGEVDDAGLDEEDQYLQVSSSGQPSPVIREEKPGWVTYLLLGLLLVVILVAVVYFLTR